MDLWKRLFEANPTKIRDKKIKNGTSSVSQIPSIYQLS
jgi:hypothetical protein